MMFAAPSPNQIQNEIPGLETRRPQEKPTETPLPVGWTRKPRILIIDDDPASVATLKLSFQKQGCEVHVANSGYEGLDELTHERYDLLVIDWIMPGMDGVETIRKIDKLVSGDPHLDDFWQRRPLAVITYSGFVFPWHELPKTTHFHFLEHWHKPINYKQLKLLTSMLLMRLKNEDQAN